MAKSDTKEVVNPFDNGVNYDTFLATIPKGVKVEEYLKDTCTAEQIEWLIEDLKHYNKK